MSHAGGPQAAALGKRISEPRAAKRGAKAARAEQEATSPPFSPTSPTASLTRAFSAMPIIDTSSSSSEPGSSPGRTEPSAQRAASLDSLPAKEVKAKSPKSRYEPKPRQKKPVVEKKPEPVPELKKEKFEKVEKTPSGKEKRQDDQLPEPTAMVITPTIAPTSNPTPAPVPSPSPAPGVAAPREKKKLNLPRNEVAPPPAAGRYACPYCASLFEEPQLIQHVLSDHSNANPRVICPLCAVAPDGDPNLRSRNFQGHLQARHGGAMIPKKAPRKYVAPPPEIESERNEGDEDQDSDRWVMVTTNLNRLRDRSLEGLWDYVLSFDRVTLPARCTGCSSRLAVADPTCLLACGHTYHAACLSETDPDPECPLCLSMGKDSDMKD